MTIFFSKNILKKAAWVCRVVIMLAASIACYALCSGIVSAQPQKTENARPADCLSCHKEQKVLPDKHIKTDGMKLSACVACHKNAKDSKKPDSLRGVITLSHAHQFNGVGCVDCHGEKKPVESPDSQKCIGCHTDYKKSPRTDMSLANMHDSHMGDLDCMLCHHMHAKSENFCGQCHWWKFRVP